MDAIIDGVKARMKAASGDNQPVVKAAGRGSLESQNGGADVEAVNTVKTTEEKSLPNEQDVSLEQGEGTMMTEGKSPSNSAQTHCGQCQGEFGSKVTRPSGRTKTKETECSFCGVWQCGVCTKFKVNDLALLERNDVFYACMGCQGAISKLSFRSILKKISYDKAVDARMSAMEKKMNRLSEIESKLDSISERLSDNGTGTGGSTGLATMETKLNSIIEHLPSAGLKDMKESLDETKANVETVSKEINSKVTEMKKTLYSAAVGDNPDATVTYTPEQTQEWITKT